MIFNLINGGLEAKGEYIIFLYQDDFFTSNDVLEKLYDIATKKFEEKIDTVNYRICISLYNKDQIESLNYISTVNLNNVNKILKSPDIFLK